MELGKMELDKLVELFNDLNNGDKKEEIKRELEKRNFIINGDKLSIINLLRQKRRAF